MSSTRRAVVSGASIAGLSAAFWLERTGWQVTVLERAPRFRDGGQNVDLRGVAKEVLRRMGLVDAVKAQNTTETSTVLVDRDGQVTAELPSDGVDGATAELEVLRGDLALILRDALNDGVELLFGDTVGEVDEQPDGVVVTTERGRRIAADLLVVAEGVRSRTRDRLFGPEVERRDLDIDMVFGTIPRAATDDDRWRWFTTTGGRQVHLRPDGHGTTRAVLACSPSSRLVDLDRDEALARLRERFADAGWEAPRILDGFDASEDVYIDELMQIRMRSWHRGHVAVLGDAAWCVTPIGGGGASLALTGGYVLAASLAARPGDVGRALEDVEAWMRPLVDEVQHLPRGITHFAYPQTRPGVAVRGVLDKILTSAPLKPVAARFTRVAETDRELPALPAV